jgi:hypothetical protein
VVVALCGGASKRKKQQQQNQSTTTTTKDNKIKKSSRRKKKKRLPSDDELIIKHALKDKDAAEALGDAICSRAYQLWNGSSQITMNPSMQSMGWALGASDGLVVMDAEEEEDDAGGVEAAPTAVVAHYFLNSLGGAHALQCKWTLCGLNDTPYVILCQTHLVEP